MADFGMQLFKDDGATVMWDSRTVVGGVVADVISLSASGAGTFTYPIFAGRGVMVVNGYGGSTLDTVTTDTSLGYPRVVISNGLAPRKYIVVIY